MLKVGGPLEKGNDIGETISVLEYVDPKIFTRQLPDIAPRSHRTNKN